MKSIIRVINRLFTTPCGACLNPDEGDRKRSVKREQDQSGRKTIKKRAAPHLGVGRLKYTACRKCEHPAFQAAFHERRVKSPEKHRGFQCLGNPPRRKRRNAPRRAKRYAQGAVREYAIQKSLEKCARDKRITMFRARCPRPVRADAGQCVRSRDRSFAPARSR